MSKFTSVTIILNVEIKIINNHPRKSHFVISHFLLFLCSLCWNVEMHVNIFNNSIKIILSIKAEIIFCKCLLLFFLLFSPALFKFNFDNCNAWTYFFSQTDSASWIFRAHVSREPKVELNWIQNYFFRNQVFLGKDILVWLNLLWLQANLTSREWASIIYTDATFTAH